MATSIAISHADFSALMRQMCRFDALKLLGHPHPKMIPVGDIPCLSPLKVTDRKIAVRSVDVPWLHAGKDTQSCEGAIVYRYKTKIVTVRCYVTKDKFNVVCPHCAALWGAADDDLNYYILPTAKPVVARYKQGPRKALRQQTRFIAMSRAFDDTIAKIEERCDKVKCKLPDDWPGFSFKNMCDSILVDSGVVFPDALSRSYMRSTMDEHNLAGLIGTVQQIYLRIAMCFEVDTLAGYVDHIVGVAKQVELAAMYELQRQFPEYPVFQGPLVTSDVILLGFGFAEQYFMKWMKTDSSDEASLEEFSWGPAVTFLEEWAKEVKPAARPPRPANTAPVSRFDIGLPNDFLLSGSTFYSSQETLFDFSQQSSDHSDPDYTATPPTVRKKKTPKAKKRVEFSPAPDDSDMFESAAPTIRTPVKSESAHADTADPPAVPPSPAGFWVILEGKARGICTSYPEFQAAIKTLNTSNPEYLYTRDRDVAEDALKSVTSKPSKKQGRVGTTCYAVKGTHPGIHASKAGAEAVRKEHGGEVRRFTSKTKARKWLYQKQRRKGALTEAEIKAVDWAEDKGDPTILEKLWPTKRKALKAYVKSSPFERPFTDEWIALRSVADAKNPAPAGPPDIFVVRNGTSYSVAQSVAEAQKLMAAGTDTQCSGRFYTTALAKAFIAKEKQTFNLWYVVTKGHKTGVMTQKDCVAAVSGFDNPALVGPFRTRHEADVRYISTLSAADVEGPPRPPPAPSSATAARPTYVPSGPTTTAPTRTATATPAVTVPAEVDITAHESAYPYRRSAFAARTAAGTGTVALDYHVALEASNGQSPKAFSKGKTIWDNIVAAERWLASTQPTQPAVSRLQQARARASAAPAATPATTPATNPTGTSGPVGGGYCGTVTAKPTGREQTDKTLFCRLGPQRAS